MHFELQLRESVRDITYALSPVFSSFFNELMLFY